MQKAIGISLIIFFFLGNILNGQSSFLSQPTFTLSVFNHSIGLPIKDVFKFPLNLGVTAGVEFSYSSAPIPKHLQRFEMGWYTHKNAGTSLWIKSDYIRRFTHKTGLEMDFQGGIGYIHDFNYNQSYVLNTEGQYEKISDPGNGGMLFSLGIGTAYTLEISDNTSIIPFIRYEAMLQTPYSELLPFLPHSMFNLGTRIQL